MGIFTIASAPIAQADENGATDVFHFDAGNPDILHLASVDNLELDSAHGRVVEVAIGDVDIDKSSCG